MNGYSSATRRLLHCSSLEGKDLQMILKAEEEGFCRRPFRNRFLERYASWFAELYLYTGIDTHEYVLMIQMGKSMKIKAFKKGKGCCLRK